MNFFDHKGLGNHLLQLCPKVVKHPVYPFLILALNENIDQLCNLANLAQEKALPYLSGKGMREAPEREFMPGIEIRTFSIKSSQAYYIAWTMCSIKYMTYFDCWFSKLSICLSLSRAAAMSHNNNDMVFKVQSADSGPPAKFGVCIIYYVPSIQNIHQDKMQ